MQKELVYMAKSMSTEAHGYMGICSEEATLPYSFLPPFSMWFNSLRKEFAPLGVNSFL